MIHIYSVRFRLSTAQIIKKNQEKLETPPSLIDIDQEETVCGVRECVRVELKIGVRSETLDYSK